MSAFIGPIHYWLYEKIRLVTQRENFIYKKAYELCGSTAEELREQVWQVYGAPLPEKDLSELIDHENIHGWLQRQIKVVETREAAFIKELLDGCGDHTKGIIKEAFIEHGKVTGEKVKLEHKHDISTAPGIYKALNDYYLNGMPCDQADRIVESETDSVVWETGECLQEPNWKRAGVDAKIMTELYQSWLRAFVGAVNSEFSFRQVSEGAGKYEISRNVK
jgi:transposase-like protein